MRNELVNRIDMGKDEIGRGENENGMSGWMDDLYRMKEDRSMNG